MRILLTGAGGNIGHGLADRLTDQGEHDLVLTDLIRPAWLTPERYGQVQFTAIDVQIGVGLDSVARECDAIVHLPAWHGIHSRTRSEIDFWRLNVDGTFGCCRPPAAPASSGWSFCRPSHGTVTSTSTGSPNASVRNSWPTTTLGMICRMWRCVLTT